MTKGRWPFSRKEKMVGHQWLTPTILAILEAEVVRLMV
jgi:hypothetical protein